MKRIGTTLAALAVAATTTLQAQAVPDLSQAARVSSGYRRSPVFGVDPFRHVMVPKWGFVLTTGGTGANNALNLEDIGALSLLNKQDDLRIGDVIDALTLIPEGQGLLGTGQVEGGAYLGMSFGSRFTLGITATGRAYGQFELDDDGVALLRDGNSARQDFTLGESNVLGLSTLDIGVHTVIRTGPFTSIDGVQLAFGIGLRNVRPAVFARVESVLDNGGMIRVTGDSVDANLAVELTSSIPLGDDGPDVNFWSDALDRIRGNVGGSSSLVADLLVRAEWPTSGFAIEGMVTNLGSKVGFTDLARRVDTLLVQTTQLDDVREELDSLDFDVRDSVAVSIGLPRVWRFTASSWANAILQLDVSASGSFSGELQTPLTVDLGTTWRLVRHLPLRAGVVLGGRQGIGYSGGFAIESDNFLFQVSGQSLGGWFRDATGVGGRFDLGFFF
jgi:hypothetical protein